MHITYHVACGGAETESETVINNTNSNNIIETKENNNHNNNRIFIHCKAGRGRAATFALCYLISKGYALNEATNLLVSRRHVIDKHIMECKVVQKFVNNYKKYNGNIESMLNGNE